MAARPDKLSPPERERFKKLIAKATFQGNYEMNGAEKKECAELLVRARTSGDPAYAEHQQDVREFNQRYGAHYGLSA